MVTCLDGYQMARQGRAGPAPMLLGFVLGPMLEENLRRALLISEGNPLVFVTRPISLAFILATILILITMAGLAVRKRRGDIIG